MFETAGDVDGQHRTIELRRDGNAFIISVTGEVEGVLGWRPDQLVGSPSTMFIHPHDQASAVTAWMNMIEQPGRPHRWRGRYRRADGTWAWVETVNTNQLDTPGVGVVVSVMQEIPAGRLSVEEQLRAQEELLSKLADALPVGIVQFGRDRSVLFANDRLNAILDRRGATDLDQLLAGVVSEDQATLDRAVQEVLSGRPVDDVEVHVTVGGEAGPLICTLSMRALTDAAGTINGAVATVNDITCQARLRRQLERQAMTDELTGCANRRATLQKLDEALASRTGPGDGVAIVFIDLDEFKHINDTYGHVVGDEVLVATANRLCRAVRPDDHVGRLGGDEFLVVLRDVHDTDAARQLAERIDAAVNADLTVDGHTLGIRASVGTAYAGDPADPDELIASADRSMYRRKQRVTRPLPIDAPGPESERNVG